VEQDRLEEVLAQRRGHDLVELEELLDGVALVAPEQLVASVPAEEANGSLYARAIRGTSTQTSLGVT
jgi:hypothetical protein